MGHVVARPLAGDHRAAAWAEDAIAVMDAVGCGQAAVLATSYNAMSGLVLAADYPERVRSLVVINGTARVSWAPDYPIGARSPTLIHSRRSQSNRCG